MWHLAIIYLCVIVWPTERSYAADDVAAIEDLIVETYVEAVYVNRDEQAVREGFHSSFVLHVYRDGEVVQESLTDWLDRLQLDGVRTDDRIDYEIGFIDITGNSAIARLEIFRDSIHLYTDYFGFYRFDGRWLFINKTFFAHE